MTNAADDDVRTRALAPRQSLCSLIAINEMVAFFFFFCTDAWVVSSDVEATEIYVLLCHLIILMAVSVLGGSMSWLRLYIKTHACVSWPFSPTSHGW